MEDSGKIIFTHITHITHKIIDNQMKNTNTNLPEIKLLGITARTSNAAEMDPSTAKIGATLQKYFGEGVPDKIPGRANPAVTYCAYTEYESDFTGSYTYFVGEEVTSFENIPEGFKALVIPPHSYMKFTNEAGPMPQVCIDMWQQIWQMEASGKLAKRSYIADFEVYDERSRDPKSAVLDIYIGIKG